MNSENMRRRILVFAPYAINTPHFETQLEIIEDHLQKADEVVFLGCNAELKACDVNWQHDLFTCFRCMSRRNHGLKLLSRRLSFAPFFRLTAADRREQQSLRTEFSSMEDLKSYRIGNFDIGFGIASSLISILKEAQPDPAAYRDVVRNFLLSSFAVYRSMQNHLDAQNVDLVYLYNGRYAPLRAAMRACQSRKVAFKVHEVGHSIQHYALWDNTIPHDPAYTDRRIREEWLAAAANPQREEVASAFYTNRAKGIEYVYLSFTAQQQEGLLPPGWDSSRKNIVFFNSSEYEFAAIGDEWKPIVYESQHQGLLRIVRSLEERGNGLFHVYLRMHPNLKGVSDHVVQAFLGIRSPYLTIIPPESPVSSYALLKAASKSVTFSSTVGIEAVFWGVPSIALGMSYYYGLGGTYNPKSHEEVMDLLTTDLPPGNREPALMYGYYLNSFGIPFKYYDPQHIFSGRFKGEAIRQSWWVTAAAGQYNRHMLFRKPIQWVSEFLLARGV